MYAVGLMYELLVIIFFLQARVNRNIIFNRHGQHPTWGKSISPRRLPLGVPFYLIALFANDVTRYHDYASGSHRGASRTNYSPKWPLAIGMRCRR